MRAAHLRPLFAALLFLTSAPVLYLMVNDSVGDQMSPPVSLHSTASGPTTHPSTSLLSTEPQLSASSLFAARRRAAVCFFGLTRSLRKYTYESVQKYLLGRLHEQNFEVDIFLHTFALDVLFNPWANEFNVSLDKEEWRLLEPLVYEIEELAQVDASINYASYLKYGNPWEDFNPSNITVFNHVRQLRSQHRCWNLIEKHMNETGKEYDYVLFARPDVRYAPPGLPDLEPYCLSKQCTEAIGQKRIGVAYSDRFVVGTPEVVKLWATRDDIAFFFMDRYQLGLQSETFSLWTMKWFNVEDVQLPFCFERIRADGKPPELGTTIPDLELCLDTSLVWVLPPLDPEELRLRRVPKRRAVPRRPGLRLHRA